MTERKLAVMGASGWMYTAAGVAEMVDTLVRDAGEHCGPGGVDWLWGQGRGEVFHATAVEVQDAAAGYSGRLRERLTNWLRERGAYAEPRS